jgi:hypothetical protein
LKAKKLRILLTDLIFEKKESEKPSSEMGKYLLNRIEYQGGKLF